jgi:hypothetical protein
MEATVSAGRKLCLCALALGMLIVGCNDKKEDESRERLKSMAGGELKKVVPVSGKVLLDGQPKGGVTITLHPETGTATMDTVTKSDGTYCWQTYEQCDGVAPGSYKVVFRLMPKQGRNDNVAARVDELKGKYSDPRKSEFKLTVEAGYSQTDVNYELSTK